jgi:asparagine synthase (glutamine-hydrolysing)
MCGLGGIFLFGTDSRRFNPSAMLSRIDARIAHRGPDGTGTFASPSQQAWLCHRRLSIIDHAGGAQPMLLRAGHDDASSPVSAALAYNGCLYNQRALRSELIREESEQFTSDHSDTEVVLRGLARRGEAFLSQMEGMFAIALWTRDAAGAERLLLARDLAGEKPLYVLQLQDGVIFASSAGALIAEARNLHPHAAATNAGAVLQSLAFGFSDQPLFGVRELTPGTWIEFEASGRSRGGTFAITPRSLLRSEVPLTLPRTVSLLRTAVHARLEADVPLGCFLSGGIDSSLVTAFAREVRPDLETFCVAMPDPACDESRWASLAAAALGTRHQTLPCSADAAADLVHLIEQLGMPFGDSSLLPTYWVSKAAAAHVKVALSGDGGDELFRGYRRHVAARHLRSSGSHLGPVAALSSRWHPRMGTLGRFLGAAAGIGYPQISALFQPSELSKLVGTPAAAACFEGVAADWGARGVADAPWWDYACYLPGDLLRKVDTASMAVALEVRSPLLDSELTRACLAAGEAELMPSGARKGLLREVARTLLPAKLVDRPKQGFSIPLAAWLRTNFGGLGDLMTQTLTQPDPFPQNVLGIEIDRRFVGKLVHEHLHLGRDHSQKLYMLLSLALWCRWVSSLG